MAGDRQPNPGPTAKYFCPVCARYVTSRGVSYGCTRCSGWVHAKYYGLLNAAQYRRNKDWTCDPCSVTKTQQSTPPPPSPSPAPAPSAEQISEDSTFNVLQFIANGIGNKLTELGVVLERNKVKVAVIQESKLSSTKMRRSFVQFYLKQRHTTSLLDDTDSTRNLYQQRYWMLMTRRDDLHKRDPTSPELPRLNYDIQNRIYAHKKQKWIYFVETVDQMTMSTSCGEPLKEMMAEQNVKQRTKQLPSMEARSHRPSSLQPDSTNSFNTSKLGRHTSSSETD